MLDRREEFTNQRRSTDGIDTSGTERVELRVNLNLSTIEE